jgi:5-methylcytosine-specific restriction endonuclease McrA
VRHECEQRRGSARDRGYGTRWDKASLGFRRSHPLCLGCQATGRIEVATVTDHVVPHKGDVSLFWDRDRWQPACDWHHSVVKQKLEALYAKGRVSVDDLWLNSEKAVALTRELDPRGGG